MKRKQRKYDPSKKGVDEEKGLRAWKSRQISTPSVGRLVPRVFPEELSGVSGESSGTDRSVISGFGPLELSPPHEPAFADGGDQGDSRHAGDSSGLYFVFEESIEEDVGQDPDDPTYNPDVNISLINPAATAQALEVDLPHMVFDVQQQEEAPEDLVPNVRESLIKRNPLQKEDILENCCIAYEECLKQLAAKKAASICTRRRCNAATAVQTVTSGSAIYLKWVCEDGHISDSWCSQPTMVKGLLQGNFQLLASLVLSGNNYQKISLMARFLNLGIPTETTFHRWQRNFINPVITDFWQSLRDERLQQLKKKDIIITGDGRNDSPGHTAKYCTYTVMDIETEAIVEQIVVDKRETDLKSGNMETKGFQKALGNLQNAEVKIKEVVTDANPSVSALMSDVLPEFCGRDRENEPLDPTLSNLVHIILMVSGRALLLFKVMSPRSRSVWWLVLGSENKPLDPPMSKLAAQEKGCKDLLPWTGHITNHFWHCARECKGSEEIMLNKWRGVLHHVVNVHEWALGCCEHGELEPNEDKKWLEPDSAAHKKLRDIVYNTRLLHSFPYYVNFRSNSAIETFNNHILMYAGKRFAYSFQSYKARNHLAAIDYNMHLQRPVKLNKKGETVYHRSYSKHSHHWQAYPVKELKGYTYIPDLLLSMGRKLESPGVPMRQVLDIPEGDPRLLALTIAPHQPKPTAEIVREQLTRFKKGEPKPSTSKVE
ncbi:hypothetical protein ScPMuIL_004736 [Solemya velum]